MRRSNSLSLKFSACIMFLKIYQGNIKDLMPCFVQPLELEVNWTSSKLYPGCWQQILFLIAIQKREGGQARGLESGQLRSWLWDPHRMFHWSTCVCWVNDIFICNEKRVLLECHRCFPEEAGVLILPSQLLCLFEDGLPTKCVFVTSGPFPKVENTGVLPLVT